MDTQGYKKIFCLGVNASTSVATEDPLLLKMQQMAFWVSNRRNPLVLGAAATSEKSKCPCGEHRSPNTADDHDNMEPYNENT